MGAGGYMHGLDGEWKVEIGLGETWCENGSKGDLVA